MEENEEMTFLEKIAMKVDDFFCNTERDLKKETRRVYRELKKQKIGTAKYQQILDQYNTLRERLDKTEEIHSKIPEALAKGIAGVIALIAFRFIVAKSEDPWFRDIGRSVLKLFHIG